MVYLRCKLEVLGMPGGSFYYSFIFGCGGTVTPCVSLLVSSWAGKGQNDGNCVRGLGDSGADSAFGKDGFKAYFLYVNFSEKSGSYLPKHLLILYNMLQGCGQQ